MSTTLTKSRYTEEQIETALTVLALCGGRARMAADQLAERHDLPIDESTLRWWRDKSHTDRYTQLAADQESKVRERVAAQCEQVMFAATAAELEALTQLRQAIARGDIPSRELPGAIRNLSTAKGINFDKAAAARDRPTAIVEYRAPDEVLSALKSMGFGVIEGQAQPIQDAEVVDGVPAIAPQSSSQRA